MTAPFALYRYFDVGGRLLYVGITGMLAVREGAHRSRSRWMDLAANSTIERFATEAEARAAERTAIKSECPLFNVKHNETLAAWERLRVYLAEIGRLDLLPVQNVPSPRSDSDRPSARKPAQVRKPAGPRPLKRCNVFVMMIGGPCGYDLEVMDPEFGWCRVHGERRLIIPSGCTCYKTSEGDAQPVIYQTQCDLHGVPRAVKQLCPKRVERTAS